MLRCARNEISVSIHAFRGEGDFCSGDSRHSVHVSIHAFRGEGDSAWRPLPASPQSFQSTPSGGKATGPGGQHQAQQRVSIHAFRGEGDFYPASLVRHVGCVSIHAFRGEGDSIRASSSIRRSRFQSTPSGGKATTGEAALEGKWSSFNPRLPGGRRLAALDHPTVDSVRFNPRLPGGRRRRRWQSKRLARKHCFNPRLPGGRRRRPASRSLTARSRFNPRLPGGKAT